MKVSVIMACRNSNEELLSRSIKSVLCQTYKDFEFIIVDDGSAEPLSRVVGKISQDYRLKVYQISNSGLGAALNYGVQMSKGEYICRIDDDDAMTSDRMAKQVDYLDKHPDVSCLGTQFFFEAGGSIIKHRHFPTDHESIFRDTLSLRWALAHSSLMYRRCCFDKIGGYRVKGVGQDVDLFIQMGLVGKLANIDEYLTYYHLSSYSLSAKNPSKRLEAYLFAFSELQNQNTNPEYQVIISKSIESLKKQIASADKSKLSNFPLEKILFTKFVQWFGKKITFNNLE